MDHVGIGPSTSPLATTNESNNSGSGHEALMQVLRLLKDSTAASQSPVCLREPISVAVLECTVLFSRRAEDSVVRVSNGVPSLAPPILLSCVWRIREHTLHCTVMRSRSEARRAPLLASLILLSCVWRMREYCARASSDSAIACILNSASLVAAAASSAYEALKFRPYILPTRPSSFRLPVLQVAQPPLPSSHPSMSTSPPSPLQGPRGVSPLQAPPPHYGLCQVRPWRTGSSGTLLSGCDPSRAPEHIRKYTPRVRTCYRVQAFLRRGPAGSGGRANERTGTEKASTEQGDQWTTCNCITAPTQFVGLHWVQGRGLHLD